MMWRTEIMHSWQEALAAREEWDALVTAAAVEHPFLTRDWFACWYSVFAPEGAARIVFLRESSGVLRAILPGYIETRRLGGLPVRCFCYAANGYSSYGGVIAGRGDKEAIGRILLAAVSELCPAPHLLIMPYVQDGSDTAEVISRDGVKGLGRRIEHSQVVPFFSMPSGWDDYLANRSASLPRRLRNSLSRCTKLGRLEFEEFATIERSAELIERLQRLDARTWQGQQGSGLFSTSENARFYNRLLSFSYQGLACRVYLATIGGRDAAYSLTLAAGGTLHVLKMGYDPDFASCSPGVLTMQQIGERACAYGLKQVDLGPDLNEEKLHWVTHSIQVKSWWLINRNSLRGCALEFMLRLHEIRRKRGEGNAAVRAEG